MNPTAEIATNISSIANPFLLRLVIGTPTSATNTSAPPLFHGTLGARFAALVVAVIVSVVLPVPPLVSVTEGALAEITPELTLVANVTIPA
jgi:hypothetical protein